LFIINLLYKKRLFDTLRKNSNYFNPQNFLINDLQHIFDMPTNLPLQGDMLSIHTGLRQCLNLLRSLGFQDSMIQRFKNSMV